MLAVLTGNISNKDLLAIFETNMQQILDALEEARFVELGSSNVVIHRDPADAPEDENT